MSSEGRVAGTAPAMTGPTMSRARWTEAFSRVFEAMADLLARPEMDYILWGHLLGDSVALYGALDDVGVPADLLDILERATELSLDDDTVGLGRLAPLLRGQADEWRRSDRKGDMGQDELIGALRIARWLWVGWLDIARPLPAPLRRQLFTMVRTLRPHVPVDEAWYRPARRAAPMVHHSTASGPVLNLAVASFRGDEPGAALTVAPSYLLKRSPPGLLVSPTDLDQIATVLEVSLPAEVDSLAFLVNCKVVNPAVLRVNDVVAVDAIDAAFDLGGPECDPRWLYDEWLFLCEYLFDVLEVR